VALGLSIEHIIQLGLVWSSFSKAKWRRGEWAWKTT
jgi:hypothetical protein